MTDVSEAVEGIVALVASGFVLLLIGSGIESSTNIGYDIDVLGALMILLAIVLTVALVATLIGELVGR